MLEGGFEELVFCNECWAQFITASGLAMGLVYPTEDGATPEATESEPAGPLTGDDEQDEDVPEREPVTVPEGAATEDQRPAPDDPAPY